MHETMFGIRSTRVQRSGTDRWIEQVMALHKSLELCPADLIARGRLAALLEELHEWDGALFQWRRILAYDSNHLDAWEGLARCRKASHDMGFPPHHSGADPESM